MSYGDTMCQVCGNWLSNHKDGKPCQPFTRLQCSCGWYSEFKPLPLTCPRCKTNLLGGNIGIFDNNTEKILEGLQKPTYESTITYQNRPCVVDIVVIRHHKSGGRDVLMITRKNDPGKGRLALPGGFVEITESAEEAGVRELREETGIVLNPHQLKLLGVFSSPDRDPRHTLAIAYIKEIDCDETGYDTVAGDDASGVAWCPIELVYECDIAFDHWSIIQKYKDDYIGG